MANTIPAEKRSAFNIRHELSLRAKSVQNELRLVHLAIFPPSSANVKSQETLNDAR